MLPDRGETLGARQKTRQRRQRDFENVEQDPPEVITDDQLVGVALAADCDVNTALDILLEGSCGRNKRGGILMNT